MGHITILGSGTCNLVPEKAAASVLIEQHDLRLVYDFERGIAIRLTEAGLAQDDVEHIFISHFHPDHLTDLYPYLHAASWSHIDARTKDVTIYGPKGAKALLGQMFEVFGWDELGRNFNVTVQEVEGGLTISGQTLQVVDLHHSHGLRLGSVAIAGDASLNDALIGLIKSAELAVFDAGHITDDEICTLAAKTQAKKLVCSHQYRPLDEEKLNQRARQLGYNGRIIVASDLMKFEF